MNKDLPISFSDITTPIVDETTGKVASHKFTRSKAAKSIMAKIDLAVEVFDAREDNCEIWLYDNGYWRPGGAQIITYILDEVAEDYSDSQKIADVLRRIRGKLRLKPVEFDTTNPHLVGCKNGILDLKTGKFRLAQPTDLLSMPIPVTYDPQARCPEFIKFLQEVMATEDDILSAIDFLASLLIAQPMEFFVCSPGLGANGRTTFKDFIRRFIGSDAVRSIPLKDLSSRFTSGFLARTRVNFCSETEVSVVVLDFIKRSSEKMPVEQKFKGMSNVLLYLKYFFDTNTMPGVPDNSYGAERRFIRWDMPWRFTDQPNGPMEKLKDPETLARITTDQELSGVLNMVVERAPSILKNKMIHHADNGLKEYALQSRSGDIFLDQFFEATNNQDHRVHKADIKEAYQRYCNVTNSSMLSSKGLKTLIHNKLARLPEKNVKIDGINRSGYTGLKFDKELFDRIIEMLEKARQEGKPVFQVLLSAFPDLQSDISLSTARNTTNSTNILPNSTNENDISSTLSRIVEKYSRGSVEEKERDNNVGDLAHRESKASKNTTLSTFSTDESIDSDNAVEFGRENSENGRSFDPEVEEYLATGGQAGSERFLQLFPQARNADPEIVAHVKRYLDNGQATSAEAG